MNDWDLKDENTKTENGDVLDKQFPLSLSQNNTHHTVETCAGASGVKVALVLFQLV